MTTLIDDFISITYEILSLSSNVSSNITNSELLHQALSNGAILVELASKTGLSVEQIVLTTSSVYENAQNIQHVYETFHSVPTVLNDSAAINTTYCGGRMDNNNLVIISFVPALIIMIILSCLNTRLWKRGCCGGRPGLAIPVNLLDSYEDRYTYSFAFAATASRIVQIAIGNDFSTVFGDEFRKTQNQYPSYVKAIFKLVAAFVVGVSYYPFFACISTHQRLLGAVLGTIYSTIWFLSYLFQIIDCADSPDNELTVTESILQQGTSILFHGLLLLAFLRVFIRCLISKRRGMVVSKDEWKENYKYHYVKKLLKPIPKGNETVITVNGLKQKVISNVYRWKPDFKYSTRIICIYITGGACLYLIIIAYIILGRYLKLLADGTVDFLESAETSEVDWDRIRDGIKVVIICWMVAIGIATIKDIVMIGNMLSWYRGHVLRLQRGDRSFLPYNIENQNPVDIMVSSFKFAGYQAGYILWGFLISQLVLFCIITVIAMGFIWPLTYGASFRDALIPSVILTVWPTFVITLITILVQKLLAKFVFLRDSGAMLALNNRRLFHIASYFFFFLNILVGLFSCLIRIVYAIILGALFLPRLQKSALPRDWELFDPGYKTYIGYLFLEHTHTNPVLFTFSRLMWEYVRDAHESENNDLAMTNILKIGKSVRKRESQRARIRWFVALTLINNPSLVQSRKREMAEPEKEKGPCTIKLFTNKVAQKFDAIRENVKQKHDTQF